ncbi:MAG: zinc ribbon domain-containing protein [Planctomycetes bacterium]|nr:zinc ribbon domain-containing protein [Planctomycetota bacterium]
MPTYDYLCAACGKHAEIFHSMAEKPRKKCPACGKLQLQRQIGTGGGVIFKGNGFYQTDYRSESYTKGAAKDKPPTAKPAADKSAGKADSGGAPA